MTLVENYAAERRARLIRLGAIPAPLRQEPKAAEDVKAKPAAIQPIRAEKYYAGMWFYNLVNYTPVQPSILDIQKACAAHFGIPLMSIINHKQIASATTPRHVGMYLARHLTTESRASIARAFYRDASTTQSGIAKIERMITEDHAIAADVAAIKARLAGGFS